jgi:hypothetical protein
MRISSCSNCLRVRTLCRGQLSQVQQDSLAFLVRYYGQEQRRSPIRSLFSIGTRRLGHQHQQHWHVIAAVVKQELQAG